jgi:hypothetical protein
MDPSTDPASPNKRRKLIEDVSEQQAGQDTVPGADDGVAASDGAPDLPHREQEPSNAPTKKNLFSQVCDVCQNNAGKYRSVFPAGFRAPPQITCVSHSFTH